MKRPLVFLFFLTIAFSIFSYLNEKPPGLDELFDEEGQVALSGTIYQITKKEKTTAIYLDHIKIQRLDGKQLKEQSYGVRKILLYHSNSESLKIKNRIFVSGTIQKFTKGTNPGQFNEYIYYKGNQIDYKVFGDSVEIQSKETSFYREGLMKIRQAFSNVFQEVLSEEDAGIICAMLLGEKSSLLQDTRDLYQKNGISHILAISGLHISMIGMFLYQLLKKIYVPNETAIPLTIIFLFSYGAMTDFSVSTNRAVVMLTISLMGILIGRTYDFISAICLSGILILLQNPLQIVNSGFLLSFGAVGAIAIVFPVLKSFIWREEATEQEPVFKITNRLQMYLRLPSFAKRKQIGETEYEKKWREWKRKVAESILVSFSIQLVTVPILLYFYFDLPIYSLFLNMLILPFVSLLIALSILVGIVGMFWIEGACFLAGSVHAILKWYQIICQIFLQFPYSIITIGRPSLLQILLYYGCLTTFLIGYKIRKKSAFILVCLGLLCIFLKPQRSGVEINMLDVGQGDGILIESDTGKNYFIDGGSTTVKELGKYRITPALKSKGISCIDYVIITHMDQDHISGITELLEQSRISGNIKIKNLIVPDTGMKDEAYKNMVNLAKKQEVSVIYLKKGDKIKDGVLKFTCIHPEKGFATEDRNDYSTVLLLEYRKFRMLFTGDVSNEGEEAVIENPQLKQCDILKVAHHGSKYTNSKELLDIVKPRYALISAARGNDYGHPHKEVLDRLKVCGAKTFCTIDKGAIQVKSDGKHISINFYKNILDK